ncbi:MAG TPA: polysaccharide ABC transporter ATP-binding protein [Puia sp.]|nr:polysaccharide ABC transporter ATP-binding protein [Puia sp.]
MKPILEVHNLAKKYRISHLSGSYLSLRERMLGAFRSNKTEIEDFWALDDISFDVEPGQSLGIIGRNGAGKSTLLKVLSKITLPTKGKIVTRGRIASLLEVGTGFHPELTGLENIFFNGSLLGMKRREIKSKLEEIVDFSGVEKFLDTPLKHYSSGMQLRLAFSVAAFLEPEILVIDEVLAVGDAEFQKKCLGKMEDVSKGGRTILFVSHSMQALASFCKTGIYLAGGKIIASGKMHQTIDKYLHDSSPLTSFEQGKETLIYSNGKKDKDFNLIDINFYQDSKRVSGNIVNGKDFKVELHYELFNRLNRFRIFLDVCDQLGTVVFRSFHDEDNAQVVNLDSGKYLSRITIPANLLAPISYDFKFLFGIHNVRMMEPKEGISFRINVEQTGRYNNGYSGQYSVGMICPVFQWEIQKS